MSADFQTAGHSIADRYTPRLRQLAQSNGLPPTQASTLVLLWDGGNFRADGDASITNIEFGDGVRRPQPAVARALREMAPELTKELNAAITEGSFSEVNF